MESYKGEFIDLVFQKPLTTHGSDVSITKDENSDQYPSSLQNLFTQYNETDKSKLDILLFVKNALTNDDSSIASSILNILIDFEFQSFLKFILETDTNDLFKHSIDIIILIYVKSLFKKIMINSEINQAIFDIIQAKSDTYLSNSYYALNIILTEHHFLAQQIKLDETIQKAIQYREDDIVWFLVTVFRIEQSEITIFENFFLDMLESNVIPSLYGLYFCMYYDHAFSNVIITRNIIDQNILQFEFADDSLFWIQQIILKYAIRFCNDESFSIILQFINNIFLTLKSVYFIEKHCPLRARYVLTDNQIETLRKVANEGNFAEKKYAIKILMKLAENSVIESVSLLETLDNAFHLFDYKIQIKILKFITNQIPMLSDPSIIDQFMLFAKNIEEDVNDLIYSDNNYDEDVIDEFIKSINDLETERNLGI